MGFEDGALGDGRTAKDRMAVAQAIGLATRSVEEGGGPFGAVVLREGKVIATGHNRVTLDNDPTAHAEVHAIRNACAELGGFSLVGCTLYSSCEPCPMCLAASLWSRVDRVVYSADRDDAAKFGFDDRKFYELIPADATSWESPRVEQHRHDESLSPFNVWLASPSRVEY